ncbi:MAG: AraC family transcriptional regulator [Clostridia bacterium]|nr:AraC family transcriptional regulator [Clostridia bacterium]
MDEIAERCGFHFSSYFRETFRQITGLTPSEYRMLVGK